MRTEENRTLEGVSAIARFSDDDVYRYLLTREGLVPGSSRVLVSIGLNPSTADAFKPDQTINKDIGFARRWGCGRLWKLNAKAFRTKSPAIMRRAEKNGVDVVGRPENDETIRAALEEFKRHGGTVVVSWGANLDDARQREMFDLITAAGVTPMCLGFNDNGSPTHELYIPYATPLVPWSPGERTAP